MLQMIDQMATKYNRGCVVVLLSTAMATESHLLVGAVALIMLVGTIWPRLGAFSLIYVHVVRPAGLIKPRPVADREAPHRFTRGFAAVALTVAYGLLAAGEGLASWILVAAIVALSMLALLLNLCVGCHIFYTLERIGLIRANRTNSAG